MAKPLKNSPKLKAPSIVQITDTFRQLFDDRALFNEPMYELTPTNIKKLKSALEIPNTSFMGEEKYKTIEEKTAALFYIVTKNHDFANGNKRTAIILSLLFLEINGFWLTISEKDMYDLSIWTASSSDKNHEKTIQKIAKIFQEHLKSITNPTHQPLISIIIPVYNVAPYLPKCLNAIKQQTYENLEIILIDDGSTDGSGKLCDDYAAEIARSSKTNTVKPTIKVIHQKNQGLSAARNAGLKIATGDFITFVDSDDTVSPDYIEYLYKITNKYHTQLAIAATKEIFPDGHTINRGAGYHAAVYTTVECLDHMLAEDGFNVTAWGKLYKRELFKNIKFPVGALHEDLATTYQTILKCDSIAYGPEPKYQYYQRQNSIISSNFSDKKLDIITFTDQMCDDIHKKFPENEELTWTLKKRRMHARFSVLRLMATSGTKLNQTQLKKQQEIINYLKSHQDWVFQNPKSSSRDRTAMRLLLLGKTPFKLGWRLYTKLK